MTSIVAFRTRLKSTPLITKRNPGFDGLMTRKSGS